MGWGMLPASMAADALRTGALVELVPGSALQVPLYWQQARAAPQLLERLKAAVRTAAASGVHALR
jgi:LysR family transcriptional regulator (chromosome initiation inhibitor)